MLRDAERFWNLFLFGQLSSSDTTIGEANIVCQLEKYILRLVSAPAPIPSHTFVSVRIQLFIFLYLVNTTINIRLMRLYCFFSSH